MHMEGHKELGRMLTQQITNFCYPVGLTLLNHLPQHVCSLQPAPARQRRPE
jgi:hypothetical protein